jgi:hypothetical protein
LKHDEFIKLGGSFVCEILLSVVLPTKTTQQKPATCHLSISGSSLASIAVAS